MNGDIKPLEFMARREEWDTGISLYARKITEGQGYLKAMPIQMVEGKRGLIVEPFARLEIQSAQTLIDELWNCGLRPSEGTGSAGSLAATEKHLTDMRKIAFKKLGIGA